MENSELKILIVEDEEDQRIRLKYVLETEGYQIFEAESGDKAVDMVKNRDNYFDMVITDLKMPGKIDGEGVLQGVQKISPNTDIIIVTAYGTIDSAVRTMINGASDYLQKPLNMPELRIKIEKILENRSIRNRLDDSEIAKSNMDELVKELKDCRIRLNKINAYSETLLQSNKELSDTDIIQKIKEECQ